MHIQQITSDHEANRPCYGQKKVKVQDILFEKAVDRPVEAGDLVNRLQKYSSPDKEDHES